MTAERLQSLVKLQSTLIAKIVLAIATEMGNGPRLLAFATNYIFALFCTNTCDLELVRRYEISEKLAQTARWDRVRLTTFRARDLTFGPSSAGRLLQTLQTEGVATRQDFGLGK